MAEDFSKLTKKQLIDRLNTQPSTQPQETGEMVSDHEKVLRSIDKASSKSSPNAIPFTETSDHTNIMLYTALNKRVGPLHPDNAKRTVERWKRAGVQLYAAKRTDEQVEAFKLTDEYKKYIEKHRATRKSRVAQSTKGKTDKMIAEIAKQTAIAAGQAVAGAKSG